MAISDGSGGAPTRVDALPEIDKRGVSRRSVLVGGAALLVGAGLMKPARALAAGPTGSAPRRWVRRRSGFPPPNKPGSA